LALNEKELPMQKVTPFLWFDNQAEEAVNLYISLFNNSKILETARYGYAGPGPAGQVMTMAFELDGQNFTALNGGPQYKFTEALSLVINCTTQEEVDKFWYGLSAGVEEGPCGWLKDKYGVSWQVVPTILTELLQDPNPAKAQSVMKAMLQMKKLNIKVLQDAYDNA
jgi:predicted 3-demethylubiquinone-9 3-methyltransferase (glyoxalase superfamily)